MNFRFTEEEETFRTEVREFIAAEMTEEVKSHWLGGLLDTIEARARADPSHAGRPGLRGRGKSSRSSPLAHFDPWFTGH